VQDSVVLIETGDKPYPRFPHEAKVGTGFFVNNGDEIVTNVHVAIVDSYVNVVTSDGKVYPAKVTKLDENDDLALLKVIGIKPDPERALKPAPTDLKKEDELVAFGHPDGSDELVASPGHFLNRNELLKLVGDPSRFPDLVRMIKRGQATNDPELKKEIEDYLRSERLHARMNIHHANSGSPLLNDKGQLEGVVANRMSAAHSLMVPGEKVVELLASPESKYEFKYESDENQNQKLVEIKRKDGKIVPPVVLAEAAKPMHAEAYPTIFLNIPDLEELEKKKNSKS